MQLMDELESWRPILGYEGIYEISNWGRVKRILTARNFRAGRFLSTGCNSAGYPIVHLSRERVRRVFAIHRLVIAAFHGPIPEGYEVDHIDGNRANSRLSNLRICTPSQNRAHSVPQGTSRFKGVFLDSGDWRASITNEGRRIWLGQYPTEEAAARAYDSAAKQIHGEYAYLNFPE